MKNGVFKEDGQYVAYKDGKVVGKGLYKYQADKALAAAAESAVMESEALSIPINKRFEFVTSLVRMVAKKQTPSMVLCGEGGLGKSHTVEAALKALGLEDAFGSNAPKHKRYTMIKGFTTPKGLYSTLYENKDGIVVFDDCDEALVNPDCAILMKAALDSNDKRVVSWNSAGAFDDGLPKSFLFTGGVIFISNLKVGKVDQAVRTRSMIIDLAMTAGQKIERMAVIAEAPDFVPNVSVEVKRQALSLIAKNKETVKDLSLRSLIKVSRILNSGEKNAIELAEYALKQG